MKRLEVRLEGREAGEVVFVHLGHPAEGCHPLEHQAAWLDDELRLQLSAALMQALADAWQLGREAGLDSEELWQAMLDELETQRVRAEPR